MLKIHLREANKGGRRMPRLPEAKKDAASCENARGTASRYRSVRVRMGQPGRQEACHTQESGRTRGTETSKYPQEEKENIDGPSSGERRGRSPNRARSGGRGVVGAAKGTWRGTGTAWKGRA